MAIITTKSQANPKPVTGFDYAGQPMKPGGFYNGRPEHMAQDDVDHCGLHNTSIKEASQTSTESHTLSKKNRGWTAERRAELGQRMRNYWAKRNAIRDKLEQGI